MIITKEEHGDQWVALMRLWEHEGRPHYVAAGNSSYQAVQNGETGEWEFRPANLGLNDFYGSRSL